MYVCICNAVKEKDLRKACSKSCNMGNGEDLLEKVGCKAQCGQCLDYIEDVIISEGKLSHHDKLVA